MTPNRLLNTGDPCPFCHGKFRRKINAAMSNCIGPAPALSKRDGTAICNDCSKAEDLCAAAFRNDPHFDEHARIAIGNDRRESRRLPKGFPLPALRMKMDDETWEDEPQRYRDVQSEDDVVRIIVNEIDVEACEVYDLMDWLELREKEPQQEHDKPDVPKRLAIVRLLNEERWSPSWRGIVMEGVAS